ncbi:MAG: FeoA family protein [bacterium]
MIQTTTLTLATAQTDSSLTVSDVSTSESQKHRLAVLGIRHGSDISVERRDRRGAVVHVGNTRLALGYDLLADIHVSRQQ